MAKKGQKKELRIVPAGVSTYFRIEYVGGGEIPVPLSGLWMTVVAAKQAITRQEAGLPVVRIAGAPVVAAPAVAPEVAIQEKLVAEAIA